ncbi:pirin family protein [Micrococcales bacterium 31B]|nr:pirin family protein [Micrococcales bacterium 31B]
MSSLGDEDYGLGAESSRGPAEAGVRVGPGVEVMEPREVPLGGPRAMTVRRTLPQRDRPFVGAWCFLDHYGPDDVAASGGMRVPRHPHTGLATVSWLFSGTIDHLDSAGNAATVRPGELNLMIAGRGITHSEFSTADTTVLHGVQLWYALPDSNRFSEPHFEHYEPPLVRGDGFTARVFLGSLLSQTSPVATRTTDLLGAELVLSPGATARLDVKRGFEHAALAETGHVLVNGVAATPGSLAYVPPGADTLSLAAGPDGARIVLLGGVPFGESIVMWWNFVGRTHDEIVEFRRRYQAEMGLEPAPAGADEALFGEFPPGQPAPLPAPALPLTRLLARPGR